MVLQIPNEVVSIVLQFLPQKEIFYAACNIFENVKDVNEVTELSSWRAIEAIVQEVASFENFSCEMSEDDFESKELRSEISRNDRESFIFCPIKGAVQRYPPETWTDLYHVMTEVFNLILTDLKSNTAFDSNIDLKRKLVLSHVVWFLFGTLEDCDRNDISNSPFMKYFAKQIKGIFHATSSSGNTDLKMNNIRLGKCGKRLGEQGQWETATNLFQLTLNSVVKDGSTETTTSSTTVDNVNVASTQGPQKKEITPKAGHSHPSTEKSVISLEDKIDIQILYSLFLVDEIYSRTWVRDSESDTHAMILAVELGREALKCSNELQETKPNLTPDSTRRTEKNVLEASLSKNSKEVHTQQKQPPSQIQFFTDNYNRRIWSIIALGRALAILGQHVKLTRTSFNIVINSMNYDGFIDDDFSTGHYSMFLEGKIILTDILVYKDHDSAADRILEMTLEELEIYAAAVSARGELFYCDGDYERSIIDLEQAFMAIQTRLVHICKEDKSSITLEKIMTIVPRSLLSLLLRCGKDLGKVYIYNSCKAGWGRGVFDYVLAISKRLYGNSHPSTINILNLRGSYGHVGLENDVNRWLRKYFR